MTNHPRRNRKPQDRNCLAKLAASENLIVNDVIEVFRFPPGGSYEPNTEIQHTIVGRVSWTMVPYVFHHVRINVCRI